ncbi:MAG TPA: VWA domain-containing protein [Candidatus Bathyarchaeia archaeon]|nr:VWA domain-containing protein [Candidatus Bathyarchaeia archaeon]
MSRFEGLTTWALIACALFIQTAMAVPVELEVATGSPVILAAQKQTVYLRVGLTGQDGARQRRRAPVNLAIVLDRSGSMSGGKLDRAKEAAIHAIGRLRDDDIVAVVAYDTNVEVIVPATKASEREAIYQAILRLQPGASTALFAGVSKGAQEIRKFMGQIRVKANTDNGDVLEFATSPYVNRIILLSDGLANEGPSTPGALGELGLSLGREGISVTTLGLGEDYNEDLMTALAQKSDGNHTFIRTAADIESAFDRELGDVLSVVAKEVRIKIEFSDGVRPVRLLGRNAEFAGQVVTTSLNQVYDGQMKYVLVEAELPALSVAESFPVASVDIAYVDTAGVANMAHKTALVEVTDRPELVRRKINKSVMVSVAQQVGADNNRIAMELRDQGRLEESKRVLTENVTYLEKNAADLDSAALRDDAKKNGSIVVQWTDEGTWRTVRKEMREYQHNTANQQNNYVGVEKTR